MVLWERSPKETSSESSRGLCVRGEGGGGGGKVRGKELTCEETGIVKVVFRSIVFIVITLSLSPSLSSLIHQYLSED